MKPILRGVAASAVLSFTLSMGVLTPAAARTGHHPGGHGGRHGSQSHSRGGHGAGHSTGGGVNQNSARSGPLGIGVGTPVLGAGHAYGAYPAGYYGYDQYGSPPGTGYSIFLGRCGNMSEFFTQFQGR